MGVGGVVVNVGWWYDMVVGDACMFVLESEGGRKLILNLQNRNNDSDEFVRIRIMILMEIDSESRIRIVILESIVH